MTTTQTRSKATKPAPAHIQAAAVNGGLRGEEHSEPNRKVEHEFRTLESLFTDPCNARAPAEEKLPPLDVADGALIASIGADGIIVPIIIRRAQDDGSPGGVIAGRRRHAALLNLQKGKAFDGRHLVMVHVMELTDAGAREVSLAENVHRLNMHPVEEHRGFASLESCGMAVEKIAQRHGMTKREVEQSLRLGRIAPEILDAWQAGTIGKEIAQSFSLSSDHERQVKVFKQLKKAGMLSRGAVRRELVGNDAMAQSMLKAVGRDVYERAGGTFARDLFTVDASDELIPENAELLKKAFDNEVELKCATLTGKGWAFAEYDPSGRRHGMDRNTKAKPGKKYGCFVDLTHEGKLEVFTGYSVTPPARTKDGRGAGTAKKKKPGDLTAVLERDLEGKFASAVRMAIMRVGPSGSLLHTLGVIVGRMIEPTMINAMPADLRASLKKIADAVPAGVMNVALRDEFDPRDYFGRIPTELARKQLIEAGIKVPATVKSKESILKLARKGVGKTKWLPPALRAGHYDGPGKK